MSSPLCWMAVMPPAAARPASLLPGGVGRGGGVRQPLVPVQQRGLRAARGGIHLLSGRAAVAVRARRGAHVVRAASSAGPKKVASAEAAVTVGLELFHKEKDAAGALELFEQAISLNPTEDEARAAYYNAACALSKLGDFAKAKEYLVIAINDHKLKFTVVLGDDDLAAFRERREFDELGAEVRGGFGTIDQQAKLRKETTTPFRNARITLLGSLLLGDLVGLIVIISQTIAALGGSEEPSLQVCLQNLGINVAAGVVLGFLVYRDVAADKKKVAVALREESLGALEVKLSAKRTVPLSRLRLKTRPVILAGSTEFVNRAIAKADRYKEDLLERGIVCVPLVYEAPRSGMPKAKGFSLSLDASEAAGEVGDGGGMVDAPALASKVKSDSRWRIEPVDPSRWQAWLAEQLDTAKLEQGENVYVQVQLNGTVRASGKGMPDWEKFVMDLPKVDDARSKWSG